MIVKGEISLIDQPPSLLNVSIINKQEYITN